MYAARKTGVSLSAIIKIKEFFMSDQSWVYFPKKLDNFIGKYMPVNGSGRAFIQTAAETVTLLTFGLAGQEIGFRGSAGVALFSGITSAYTFAANHSRRIRGNTTLSPKDEFSLCAPRLPIYLWPAVVASVILANVVVNMASEPPHPAKSAGNAPQTQQSIIEHNGPR
jgi:hypothetical protein